MATQLFLISSGADTHLGTDNLRLTGSTSSWDSRALSTSRGSGVTVSSSSSVTGPTNGIDCISSGAQAFEWISPPVSADVTISGTITLNIWASESNMSANVAINAVIEVIRANETGTRDGNTLVQIAKSARVTEVAITTRAVNNFTVAATSTVVNRGDRIRVRVFGDDAGTMAAGFAFDVSFAGTTAAADGDTYVTFAEDITFESAPAGSTLYLTNTHSGLSGAPTLISDFTGADESPLSEGGNWANLNSSSAALKRLSNGVASSSGALAASYWTPANFGPDLEAYVTLLASNANIVCRVQGEGGAATWDGYLFNASVGGTGAIQRWTNATQTVLLSGLGTWAAGDKMGCRLIGSTLQLWRQASGSSDWNLLGTVIDTTYASAGKIALLTNAPSSTVVMDDFYAATDSDLFTQKAWTSRGAGVVSYRSDTDVGWIAPLLTTEWYTPQLQAFTLAGMAQLNFRALESAATVNTSLRCEVAVVNSDGTSPTVWGTWCLTAANIDGGELGTSEAAFTAWVSGDSVSVTDGQRLRIRIYAEDTGSFAMQAGTITCFFNGTSAAASGDSYITLPQTVTEFTPAVLILEHGFVDHGNPGVL